MTRDQLRLLICSIAEVSNHQEIAVLGSLSVVGAMHTPPLDMTYSNDVDCFLFNDPNRTEEIARFGEFSDFHNEHGYYADPCKPTVASLPDGWRKRLVSVAFGTVRMLSLEPHDAAVSKLVRGESKDIQWVAAGIRAGALDPGKIERLVPSADPVMQGDTQRALTALQAAIHLSEATPDAVTFISPRL